MKVKFAPWRRTYLENGAVQGCVFCEGDSLNQEIVVYKGSTTFVTMNLYPYTSGHLMVIPYRHLSDFSELSLEEKSEMFSLLDISIKALKEYLNPGGFNVGMNIGAAAGAGIAAHLHLHVVPRWNGDTNFMTTIGEVRVIPLDIQKAAAELRIVFKNLLSGIQNQQQS
ncbi:MAG: HIT domain-containing protein [Deltaproteobacteria bacterium]|nr:HIT domain-containing protein [Deltaproteobacteria bacterium]